MRAGADKLRPHRQCVEESRAGAGKVETPGVRSPEAVLDQAGCRREKHVRRDRGHDDQVDFVGLGVSLLQKLCAAARGQMRGGRPLVDDVPFPDAGSLLNPFVAGVDHLFHVGVCDRMRRHVPADSGNLCGDALPHPVDPLCNSWR